MPLLSPCCENKMLKKGPWTAEEDEKLVAYIQENGHGSWRSLPSKDADDEMMKCRAAKMWEELQIEMDKLSEARYQEREIQLARRTNHYSTSCPSWKQVDGEESWVVDGEFMAGSARSAVDLESVAVHEIRHVLGLGHSSVEEAIMYPTISSGQRKVSLANDDVMGVQELYGLNPNYNGSTGFSPTGARDTSGTPRVDRYFVWGLDVVGLVVVASYIYLYYELNIS